MRIVKKRIKGAPQGWFILFWSGIRRNARSNTRRSDADNLSDSATVCNRSPENAHSDSNINAGYGIGSYAGLTRVPVTVTMPVTIFIPIRRHITRCPLTVGRSDK